MVIDDKSGVPVVANAVNVILGNYCQKPGHKYCACRQKEVDRAAAIEPSPTAKRCTWAPRTECPLLPRQQHTGTLHLSRKHTRDLSVVRTCVPA